jgi:hypothetical protein
MAIRQFVNVEPTELSGVVLTIDALPPLLTVGETCKRRSDTLPKLTASG